MMEEVAPPTSTVSTIGSSTCGMSHTDLSIGLDVQITSRTWPGINKPGGHATITAIHPCHTRVDVKYVLGGREKNVELIYVRPYVELDRGGRERRRDVKMNVDTLGGTQTKTKKRGSNNSNDDEDKAASASKKGRRTALSFIDGNGGKQQQGGTATAVAAVAGANGNTTTSTTTKVDNDSWTLIKVSVVRVCILTLSLPLHCHVCIYIIILLFTFSLLLLSTY
jgi:hypothetical protein